MDVQKNEKILNDIRAFFLDAILKLKFAFSKVWDFLQPFLKNFLSEAGALLAETALEVIATLQDEMTGSTGEEKRQEAFKRITASLQSKGITLAASVINSAIEVAVQKIKEK